MSTCRCFIACQYNHGVFQVIDLRNGGEPSWIGTLLARYYSGKDQALTLTSRGNLQWLGVDEYESQLDERNPGSRMVANIGQLLYEAEQQGIEWCYVKFVREVWTAYDGVGAKHACEA